MSEAKKEENEVEPESPEVVAHSEEDGEETPGWCGIMSSSE
ncbi:MAG TPA: hypothetical protein VIS06_14630 [Mycobacteriales bacterium]